jgi:AcrR family transcriptional regulator
MNGQSVKGGIVSPRSKKLSEEMRAQSRAALVVAARKLFAEQGYFNCKVSDVARQAGMSQGNVYWYFSSKEDLLKAVLGDGFETLGGILAQAAAAPGTSMEKLDHLMTGMFAFAHERGDFNTIMLSLIGHGGEALFAELGFDMPRIGLGYTQSMLEIITGAQAEGLIAEELDPTALTMFSFGLFNGMNLTYERAWLALPEAVMRDAVFRLLGVQVKARE